VSKTRLLKEPGESLVVAADSVEEGLAFLSCLFSSDDPELSGLRERVVVFADPGALSRLAAKAPNFVAVCIGPAVERELAQHNKHLHSVVIYPRNATNANPDIVLEPLNSDVFEKALGAMKCSRDDVQRLGLESGRSLTVLRRRLSRLEAIRTPAWAAD